MTKNGEKFTADNGYFVIKNFNLFIPWPPQRASKLQEKPPALKREHPAPQNVTFLNFFYF
jgi:hypothetical protein